MANLCWSQVSQAADSSELPRGQDRSTSERITEDRVMDDRSSSVEHPASPLESLGREMPQLKMNGDQPLGSQVYKYLKEMLRSGGLKPGSSIQTGTLAQQLGISKTPLRDALIQLQAEGFLKILPQRGVVINILDATELAQLVQVLGALESKAMMLAFPRIKSAHIRKMKDINKKLLNLLPERASAYRKYNDLNIEFHDSFVSLCGNDLMLDQIRTFKERMYHFPDRDYGDTWRQVNIEEHEQLIKYIEGGKARDAADFIRDIHWSFDLPKKSM